MGPVGGPVGAFFDDKKECIFCVLLGIYCERLLPADLVWDLLGDLVGGLLEPAGRAGEGGPPGGHVVVNVQVWTRVTNIWALARKRKRDQYLPGLPYRDLATPTPPLWEPHL